MPIWQVLVGLQLQPGHLGLGHLERDVHAKHVCRAPALVAIIRSQVVDQATQVLPYEIQRKHLGMGHVSGKELSVHVRAALALARMLHSCCHWAHSASIDHRWAGQVS